MPTVLSKEAIAPMKRNKLQQELKKRGLPASGTNEALRQRLELIQDEEPPAAERLSDLGDHHVCPITLELPYDPVMAEDGRVYERAAIETYFEGKAPSEIKSPVTNELMGSRLVPATQIKSNIQFMIDSGAITGTLADEWNRRMQEKKDADKLLETANSGDPRACLRAGENYYSGVHGFKEDKKEAFRMFWKAHDNGSPNGTFLVSYGLWNGIGTGKSYEKGLIFATIAAERGSKIGAVFLGHTFAFGAGPFARDDEFAIYWLHKATSMSGDREFDWAQSERITWLQRLLQDQSS